MMTNNQHPDDVRSWTAVQNRVGKAMHEATPHPALHLPVALGSEADTADGRVDLLPGGRRRARAEVRCSDLPPSSDRKQHEGDTQPSLFLGAAASAGKKLLMSQWLDYAGLDLPVPSLGKSDALRIKRGIRRKGRIRLKALPGGEGQMCPLGRGEAQNGLFELRGALHARSLPRSWGRLQNRMERGKEKAGARRQRAPGKKGYFTESGAGTGGVDVSGAGLFSAGLRPRDGSTPNSISFSLSLPR